MIAITASEKKAICERYPNAYFVRTMKSDSKRHHYFIAEGGAPYRMLLEMRKQKHQDSKRKGV